MKTSKAKEILIMKKATIECNPLKRNGRLCAALYKDEVDELIRVFNEMESFIYRNDENAKKN